MTQTKTAKPKAVKSEVVEKRVKVETSDTTEEKKAVRVVRRVVKKEPVTPVGETPVGETPVGETPAETPGGTRKRREVTAESVDETFTELVSNLEEEVVRQRDMKEKNPRFTGSNIKALRSALKAVKQLQTDVRRIARKKRATRQGNNKSGFMKEAAISDAMADFLGVDHGSMMSRVECTKRLHAYILENNLQNPENRREIVADKGLTKLLKYNKKSVSEGGHGPLFYYVMQKLIQEHFIKDTPV